MTGNTDTSARCCPDADRLDGRYISGECPVVDLHRHKGMLRGLVLDGGAKPRPLAWHRNGRLSPKAASPFDLEKIG